MTFEKEQLQKSSLAVKASKVQVMKSRLMGGIIWCELFLTFVSLSGTTDDNRWWPRQAMPKALVRLAKDMPEPRAASDMLAQSVAGLAAKAVNEGRSDEMVWVGTDNIDIE